MQTSTQRRVLLVALCWLCCALCVNTQTTDFFGDEFPHCKNRCSGHGVCVDYKCSCARGWTNEDCSRETCPYDCQNGGLCQGTACVCATGFTGLDCSLLSCTDNCNENGICLNGTCSCFTGFGGPVCNATTTSQTNSCPNNCSATLKHGVCQGGICYCTQGWSGEDCGLGVCDGGCSGHGECTMNADGEPTCVCTAPYTGSDCSLRNCESSCGSHGSCDTSTGLCVCDSDSWEGPSCSIRVCRPPCSDHGVCGGNDTVQCICADGWGGLDCSTRTCPNDCSYRGMCDTTTGVCKCPKEYTGPDCSFTVVGNKHMRGCQTRAHCNDRGLCVNTHCKCMRGFFGDRCQHAFANSSDSCPNGCSGFGLCNYQQQCICVHPHSGVDCADIECAEDCTTLQRCVEGKCVCLDDTKTGPHCDKLRCPQGCSGHGVCNTTNGKCNCYPSFEGEDCSVRRCPNDCSKHGVCHGNFTCLCEAGWDGLDCSVKACPNDCSNHGVCHHDTGHCACAEGWWGADCNSRLCPPVTNINNTNNSGTPCSDHGDCVNGTCVCSFGWTGPTCQNRTCPRMCNAPKGGQCMPDFTCKCNKGYHGEDCYLIQPLSVSCPNGCSGHGHCVSQTCLCASGWTGLGCEVEVCGERCNERLMHGVCNASHVCECAKGFGGLYCEKVLCLKGCNEPNGYCDTTRGECVCTPGHSGAECLQKDSTMLLDCSGHGKVSQTGDCECNSDWMGFRCEQRRCPNDCSGNGVCANGTCLCNLGFEGANCGYGSETSNYKHHCDFRCASSCIPRCKHVHPSTPMYGHYKYLDDNTGMLDGPCPQAMADLKQGTQNASDCTSSTHMDHTAFPSPSPIPSPPPTLNHNSHHVNHKAHAKAKHANSQH